MSYMNQWFVPGDGISREVITADIQRYLGPDALVKPGTGTGEYEGRPGYSITAYRTLTTQMILDLKTDSQRWRAEQGHDQRGHGVAYRNSRTHASRQHNGPSETDAPATSSPTYSTYYTTAPTPTAPYGTAVPQYSQPTPNHLACNVQPRTEPYNIYNQPAVRQEYTYPATTSTYTYPPQQPQDPYGRTPAAPQYSAPSVPAPGYYIASDGHQYPISQQPQPQQPQPGRRRGN